MEVILHLVFFFLFSKKNSFTIDSWYCYVHSIAQIKYIEKERKALVAIEWARIAYVIRMEMLKLP